MSEETKIEQVDTQEEVKTITVEEMQRRLAKQEEKFNQQLADFKTESQEALSKAVKEAEEKAKMTDKELKAYEAKEAEREKQALLDEIAALKLENTRRDLKDKAIETLSKKGMPVNDKILRFVVKDKAEDTLKAIDDMAELLNEQKRELTKSEAPLSSGGVGVVRDDETDIYKILDSK